MALPTPNLDDRRFQDIVDDAKRLIPRYCPEWTDHNVSDPGVTLIELFAWMTDMLLYRVNQVPDKVYIALLDMIGVRLAPPTPARAPITFYLSAPQSYALKLPVGVEVATPRTETDETITFSTETDLVIQPPHVIGAFTRYANRSDESSWTVHDLSLLLETSRPIAIFSDQPVAGDAFYLALDHDHSRHVLSLRCTIGEGGTGIVNPLNPPIRWQVWQGGQNGWTGCDVESDTTGGFSTSGQVILHTPLMAQQEIMGVQAFWLRCRIDEHAPGSGSYERSPSLAQLHVEAVGGTVDAHQASTVVNELLGRSDGTPGQVFKLANAPVLARDREREYLIIEGMSGGSEIWIEVDNFADSGANDQHFTLDSWDGTLTFGPTLLQPDGSLHSFGATPPQGSILRFSRYRYGGGMAGNLTSKAISVLKSAIPYVARAVNRTPSTGGRNEQTLEEAMLRAPQHLHTRTLAITAADYEHLARQHVGVARSSCLAPGAQPGASGDSPPGTVVVLVLPATNHQAGLIALDQLALSEHLRASLRSYLADRSPLGIRVEVRAPQYLQVSVQTRLRLIARGDPSLAQAARSHAEAELYRYLNPYVGGSGGDGWPFGRDLHVSEIYSLLQRIPGVEFVDEVRLFVDTTGSGAELQPAAANITVPRPGLICSGLHQVAVV